MSQNQLQPVADKKRDLITFTADDEKLIREQIARDATDSELKLFLYQARKTGLDPLAKQIYFQKRGGRMVIITGIDGYRLIADRTGKYAGSDDPVFDSEERPRKATVTVYKIVGGVRCSYSASARWDQYYPGDQAGAMWRKMPHLMLSKCAEALALRKAFPAELSGMYVREEMDQADRVEPSDRVKTIEAAIKQPKKIEPVLFDWEDPRHCARFEEIMRERYPHVDPSVYEEIARNLDDRPIDDLALVVKEVVG